MALKLDYVARETTTNLWRNVTLTIAAVVTIWVSLSLFGGAMLIRGGIDTLTLRWQDDVDAIVFLERDITEEQQDALETLIDEHPDVDRWDYVDHEESAQEFERLFERNESMINWIEENPEGVPTSYRIVPRTVDRAHIKQLTDFFAEEPGVLETTSAQEGVEQVEKLSGAAQNAIFVTAIGLLVAAVLLILNTIRMAMFARRREIEVMKLVGATNWFIRVPFMLEGMVQGLLGSLAAAGIPTVVTVWGFPIGSVPLVDKFMENYSQQEEQVSILAGFLAPSSTVTFVQILVVVLGVVIGAFGSALAISRFLKI